MQRQAPVQFPFVTLDCFRALHMHRVHFCWSWKVKLFFSLPQAASPEARRGYQEDRVHHGHFTWHQSTQGHFVPQQQLHDGFQELPQSFCIVCMTSKNSLSQKDQLKTFLSWSRHIQQTKLKPMKKLSMPLFRIFIHL